MKIEKILLIIMIMCLLFGIITIAYESIKEIKFCQTKGFDNRVQSLEGIHIESGYILCKGKYIDHIAYDEERQIFEYN